MASGPDSKALRIALVSALALLALALCLTLARHPVRVASSNGVRSAAVVATLANGASVCQGGETVPAGTDAIRLSLFTLVGPSVRLQALSRGLLITRGARGQGWTAGAVTIPVARVRAARSGVRICVALGRSLRSVLVFGQASAPARAATSLGERLPGRMKVEYLEPGATWWSSALAVARRMGLGHAFLGSWIVLLLAALMASASVLACWLLLADPAAAGGASPRMTRRMRVLRGVPRAAWVCALVACLNAVCWSFVTPPFQAPDEPDHYAYVGLLAENGSLPPSGIGHVYSPQEEHALADLRYLAVRQQPEDPTIATVAQQRELEADLAQPLSQRGVGAGVAASEPPLYYALETLPYHLSANPLVRLELMRLLSALLAALTALFAVLFLREALPGVPWTWTVGGLGVALAPLLGFISGAVNPDALLAAVSSALFYCLARGLRRELGYRLALATGTVMAVGLLSKLNFIGLVPGAVLGLLVLAAREARTDRARALRALALALALPGAPVLVYALVNVLSGHPTFGFVSHGTHLLHGSLAHELSYVWQFFLPRLPGMHSYFPGIFTTREIWFDRTIGFYGWLDTVFPGWVYDLAIVPAALIGALCARTLIAGRASVRRRAVELAVYGAMVLGDLALIGASSYVQSFKPGGELYAEPRYLLTTIALFGAVLALAARGAGRRWLPVLGTAIVVTLLAHDLFSQLQVIARYYG
jgi:hypothetical protein